MNQKITLNDVEASVVINFINDIKKSDKVSDFIKLKDDLEILSFYQLLSPDCKFQPY